MKLKPNLNVDGVKRLLVQHGEKAAFALAVLVLLWFFWTTVQLEVLGPDKQADPLRNLADATKKHVVESPWDKNARKIEVVDYPARAEHVQLLDKDYHLKVYFDKPLWVQHGKRPVPKLWPVEEPLAVSGRGILAIKKTSQDEESVDADSESKPVSGDKAAMGKGVKLKTASEAAPKGFFYVAITGLVPLRKQTAEYDDAFHNAVAPNPAKDVPVYEDIKVERAEITGANPDQLAWQEINLEDWWNFVAKWPTDATVPDVVDSQYIDPACTMPLGPLMGEDWSPAVAGHPKIPLAERLNKSKKSETKAEPAPAAVRRGRAKPGAKETADKPSAPAAGAKAASSKPEQMLFRFIDYTVEPGKQYCYRVKLKLENPNFKVLERNLEDPEQSRVQSLETAWSEPTPAVIVPRGFRVLAGPITSKPSNSPHDPEVEVCVVSFDQKRGGEPAETKAVQRGTLLNFIADKIWVVKPDHATISKWSKVDFRSNSLIVDVQGGRKLGNTKSALVEPVKMLVLDADGQARVHSELDDAEEFHSRLDPLKEPKEKPETSLDDDPYKPTKPKPRGKGKPAKTAATKAKPAASN